jgi:hypothetical protein
MEKITVKEVHTKAELNKFIAFPDKLYNGNKYRVPQLHIFEKSTLSPKKNPAFEFCEARYWLAFKGKKTVGRIAAILNHKANEIWQEKNMRFGWFDFIDDYEVSAALLKKVEEWAKEKNLELVHGPLGFSDMDLEGMLVEGFDEIGTQATLYNYPYYPVHLEKHGYIKDVDWVQFEIKVPPQVPDKIKRMASLVLQKYNLHTLKVKKAREFLPYAEKMFHTLNAAFRDLYGFVPLTDKQIKKYTKDYFSAIDPRFVCFVLDKQDDVVGFGISLYSLSEALQKAKGKLFPFGFIHILKALRKNNKVDMLLQAVKPEYHNKGIPAVFYNEMMQAYIDYEVEIAISSHALESNKSAFLMFKDYETRQHLKRRCYKKEL